MQQRANSSHLPLLLHLLHLLHEDELISLCCMLTKLRGRGRCANIMSARKASSLLELALLLVA